ncbi:uncharacterized protein TNCV_2416851 [Trichonephila clavipes]|nr:uncharacterized protein TNCV_2416851 [Trichonephila clavipes]
MRLQKRKGTVDGYEWRCRNQSKDNRHDVVRRIGGEPKSVKRLRSGDLLIETLSVVQTKSFLQAKTFSPVNIYPHKTLNSCRGIISESDLLTTTDAEILDGFSGQGVIQCPATPYLVAGCSRDNPLHEPNHSLLSLLATKCCYPPTRLEQPG